MIAFDLERICQFSYGRDLLNDALSEHERLLWELEHSPKEPSSASHPDIPNRLELIKTQILLFERLKIGKRIDSLVVLSNHYAELLGKPRMEIKEINVQ